MTLPSLADLLPQTQDLNIRAAIDSNAFSADFTACTSQASEEPLGCPKALELLSSTEACGEPGESWLAAMVAELLEPEGDLLSSIGGSQGVDPVDLDFMSEFESVSGHEAFHLQQPCRSSKRKRCFSAAD